MGSVTWGSEIARIYDRTYAAKFEPSVLGPVVDLLADLAQGGPALEFAAGTGRVALQLSSRGIAVHGIELSPHMAGQLAAKPGAEAVPVTIGDMATTRVRSTFRLVYLVANTIMNVTTQDDQLAVFANAAAHLEPGGCFVVEVEVPQLRRVPPGEAGWVFTLDPDHVGIETFDDTAAQIAWVVINGVAKVARSHQSMVSASAVMRRGCRHELGVAARRGRSRTSRVPRRRGGSGGPSHLRCRRRYRRPGSGRSPLRRG